MFNEYYFSENEMGLVYFSVISMNNTIESSLYVGDELVKRKSLKRGVHLIEKGNVSLRLEIKLFKLVPELRIDNEIVPIEKVRRKHLRQKLKNLEITNELNPIARVPKPFNIGDYKTPIILITLGIIWQIIVIDKTNKWEIPSTILMFIGYVMIFSPLIERIPDRHADEATKGKVKLIVGLFSWGLTQLVVDGLYNFWI